MDRDELRAWLRLCGTPGIGPDAQRRLLAAFGSPQAVFDASRAALGALVSDLRADAVLVQPDGLDDLLSATWAWLQEGPARDIVTLGDAAYPARLLNTADPPTLLYLTGPTAPGADVAASRHALFDGPALAVVGSRNPTPQGELNARAFSRSLAASGMTIVSGLAMGVDTAAHEGALEGPGRTIAIVGTGADRVYPRRNRDLAHRIAQQGVIVSEYPIGTPPLPPNFPRRNRIISALSSGTLVVEAALGSGSLITARYALEQGREVFAIPGSIHSPQARGCHALIRQGAKLVESAQDILEELPALPGLVRQVAQEPHDSAANRGSSGGDPLLDALGHDPASLDALLARTGMDAATLQARLLELELQGQVARLPGGLFQRLVMA